MKKWFLQMTVFPGLLRKVFFQVFQTRNSIADFPGFSMYWPHPKTASLKETDSAKLLQDIKSIKL